MVLGSIQVMASSEFQTYSVLARNTMINMCEIEEGFPRTYKLVLETEVISTGLATNHGHDSGIGSFSPSSSIALYDAVADQGYSNGEVFGDIETSIEFVSQPSPHSSAFPLSPEQLDHVNFPPDININWPPTSLSKSQPLQCNIFPQVTDENWTYSDTGSSNLLDSTNLEAMSSMGNHEEEVDMTTSTLATCQWPLETPIISQNKKHPYQALSQNENTRSNYSRRASRATPAGCRNSSLPGHLQTFPHLVRSSKHHNLPKKTEISIISAARSILRTDYLEYLEAELPRWAQGGHEQVNNSQFISADPDYYDLQIAYSEVCQLHTWMEDDVIRSRMALIRLHLEYVRICENWQARQGKGRIGRGDATCIIDHILEKTHYDWPTLSKTQHSRLRARFHERKRYGKRWAVLANELGTGILFLCSQKVVAMVCNTTVTFKTLNVLADRVRSGGGELMSLLNLMKPLADSLYRGESLSVSDLEFILEKVRCYKSSITK